MINRWILYFLFPLLFLVAGFSDHQLQQPINAKEIEKSLAKVTDSFYVSRYELTNVEFQKFIAFLYSSGQMHQATNFQSDSSSWLIHPLGIKLMEHYHKHDLFADYPVVGISYDAAQAYCEWLTKQYMADKKRRFKNVLFSLPTEKQWEESAYAGNYQNRYPWGNYLTRRTGEFMAVYRKISDQRITYDSATQSYQVIISEEDVKSWDAIPVKADSFWPNAYGIYHQSGNVAEMVEERGLAKGGSFNDPGHDIQIKSKKFYLKPSHEIGFRITMHLLP